MSELTFTSTESQAEISWTSECPPSTFDVEYTMTLQDQCQILPVSIPNSLAPVSGSPAMLSNLLPHSTYIVSISGIGSSGVSVKKSVAVTTQESGMLTVMNFSNI